MRPYHFLPALLVLAASLNALAQSPPPLDPPPPRYCPVRDYPPGTLDSCYGFINKGLGQDANGEVLVMRPAADSMMLIGGMFTTYQGVRAGRLVRVRPDGYVDRSFRVGTGFNSHVHDVAVQPDGKVLVVGNFHEYQGSEAWSVIRLNPDGSRDMTFNADRVNTVVYRVAPAPDGKVLICGVFSQVGGHATERIARLLPDGRVDTTFRTPGNFPYFNVGVQADGKVVYSLYDRAAQAAYIGRLNQDGSDDTSFTAFPSQERPIQMLSGDRILVGGFGRPGLDILQPDGTPDTTFRAPSLTIRSVATRPGGGYYLATDYTDSLGNAWGVVRLNPDGGLDTTFLPEGAPAGTELVALAGGPQPRVFFYRNAQRLYQDALLTKVNALDTTGILIENFHNRSDYFDAPVYRLGPSHLGRVLATGPFASVGMVPSFGAAILSRGGTPWQDFYVQRPFTPVLEMPDFSLMGTGRDQLFRFDSIGILQDSLPLPAGVQFGNIYPLQPGYALVVGHSAIAVRVRADGLMGDTFQLSRFGCQSQLYEDVLPLPGGRILTAGTVVPFMSVFDSLGMRDAAFDANLPFQVASSCTEGVARLALQPDGKILAAGMFGLLGRPAAEHYTLARLNPDGSLDTTFRMRHGWPLSMAAGLALQPDGKILISGSDSVYGKLERLNPDGTTDSTFRIEEGIEGPVYDLMVEGNGVLVAGGFTRAGGKARSGLARFFIDGIVGIEETTPAIAGLRVYPNPASGLLRVETKAVAELLSLDGRVLQTARPEQGVARFQLGGLPQGLYLVRSAGRVARVVKS